MRKFLCTFLFITLLGCNIMEDKDNLSAEVTNEDAGRALSKDKPKKLFLGNFINAGHDRTEETLVITSKAISIPGTSTYHRTGDLLLSYYNRRIKTWRLNLESDKFYKGDFDGNGEDDILVTSKWGMATMGSYGDHSLRTYVFKPNGTWFGGWHYYSSNDEIIAIDDFDGGGDDEILVRSPWGIGILDYDEKNRTFKSLGCYKFGKKIGYWYLSDKDKFIRFGDFNKDGDVDILVESSWGLGIFSMDSGRRLYPIMGKAYGTRFGDWTYKKGDVFLANGNFDTSGGEDLIVRSGDKLGILSFRAGTLWSIVSKPNHEAPFGYYPVYVDYINGSGGPQMYSFMNVHEFGNNRSDHFLTMFAAYPGSPRELFKDFTFRYSNRNFYQVRSGSLRNYYYPMNDRISNWSDYDKDGLPDAAVFKSSGKIEIIEYNGSSYYRIKTIN